MHKTVIRTTIPRCEPQETGRPTSSAGGGIDRPKVNGSEGVATRAITREPRTVSHEIRLWATANKRPIVVVGVNEQWVVLSEVSTLISPNRLV